MDEEKPLTPFQIKALKIVRAHPEIIPSQFAQLMWPDSPSWTRSSNCGPNGSCVGAGIRQAAGAKLSILHRAGLLRIFVGYGASRYNTEYVISDKGRRLLEEAEGGKSG